MAIMAGVVAPNTECRYSRYIAKTWAIMAGVIFANQAANFIPTGSEI
jgi:hypothetical protein